MTVVKQPGEIAAGTLKPSHMSILALADTGEKLLRCNFVGNIIDKQACGTELKIWVVDKFTNRDYFEHL